MRLWAGTGRRRRHKSWPRYSFYIYAALALASNSRSNGTLFHLTLALYSTPTINHVVQSAAGGARLPRPPRQRRPRRAPRQEQLRILLHPRHGDECDSEDRPPAAAPRRRRPPTGHHGRSGAVRGSHSHDGLLQRLRRHLRRLPLQGRSYNADGKRRNDDKTG